MEITGRIIAILPERGGVSSRTGNQWKAGSYVLETLEQYPRKMCFDVFGEDKIQQFNIQMGETMIVSFDIDAHEYQGRWFNSIRAWKVDRNLQPEAPVGAPMDAAGIPPFAPMGAVPPAANVQNVAPAATPFPPQHPAPVVENNPADDLPF